MKDIIKYIGLLSSAMLCAAVIYPLLHECGHMIAAGLVGGSVSEFRLFPSAYTQCNLESVGDLGKAAISLSGMILPASFILLTKSRNFWLWYIGAAVSALSALSFAVSSAYCISYLLGANKCNDDMVRAIVLFPDCRVPLVLISIAAALFIFASIAASRPLKRCLEYFSIIKP